MHTSHWLILSATIAVINSLFLTYSEPIFNLGVFLLGMGLYLVAAFIELIEYENKNDFD